MNVARLGDHAKFLSGFAFKSKLFNDDGTGLPIIRIRDVVRGRSETFYSGEYDERQDHENSCSGNVVVQPVLGSLGDCGDVVQHAT